MQKISTYKALLLFTLLFVLIAVVSFASFRETEQVCAEAQSYFTLPSSAQGHETLWEVISKKFLMILPI